MDIFIFIPLIAPYLVIIGFVIYGITKIPIEYRQKFIVGCKKVLLWIIDLIHRKVYKEVPREENMVRGEI